MASSSFFVGQHASGLGFRNPGLQFDYDGHYQAYHHKSAGDGPPFPTEINSGYYASIGAPFPSGEATDSSGNFGLNLTNHFGFHGTPGCFAGAHKNFSSLPNTQVSLSADGSGQDKFTESGSSAISSCYDPISTDKTGLSSEKQPFEPRHHQLPCYSSQQFHLFNQHPQANLNGHYNIHNISSKIIPPPVSVYQGIPGYQQSPHLYNPYENFYDEPSGLLFQANSRSLLRTSDGSCLSGRKVVGAGSDKLLGSNGPAKSPIIFPWMKKMHTRSAGRLELLIIIAVVVDAVVKIYL